MTGPYEDAFENWSHHSRNENLMSGESTVWNREDRPAWGVHAFIISFEELRYYRQYCEMEWTTKPLVFDGTLMATTSNRSFEENRFQHWLADMTRPSTLLPPGQGAPAKWHLTHRRMKDRETHARARAKETAEQRELRQKKDRERHTARRKQLHDEGLVYVKSKQLYLDPPEVERRRTQNRDAQRRWRKKQTTEKKAELLKIRREIYYPAEMTYKRDVHRRKK